MISKKWMFIFTAVALMFSFTANSDGFLPYVDEKGNISLPEHFRTQMSHMRVVVCTDR